MIDYICNHLNTIHKEYLLLEDIYVRWNLGSFHQTLKICGDAWWRCRITSLGEKTFYAGWCSGHCIISAKEAVGEDRTRLQSGKLEVIFNKVKKILSLGRVGGHYQTPYPRSGKGEAILQENFGERAMEIGGAGVLQIRQVLLFFVFCWGCLKRALTLGASQWQRKCRVGAL